MDATLHAGAARRTINPPLGIGKIGGRLFGEPIQAIGSDLTATNLGLGAADRRVVIQEWEIRVAETMERWARRVKMERWARRLLAAVEAGGATFDLRLQAIHVNDIAIAGMNVETFFETGLAIRERSPLPDTLVLGYANGSTAYLPRAEDHPEGGWQFDGSNALPDQFRSSTPTGSLPCTPTPSSARSRRPWR